MPEQTFAYLRVSKRDQDLEKNKADMVKLANEAHLGQVQFLEENLSGKVSWRKRQIAVLLEQAEAGDAIIVSELSCLGRSLLECMEILSLALQKDIRLDAVKGNWQLNNRSQSTMVVVAFAMAAEIERDLISQRTAEALAARKQQGMPLGRPKGVGKSKLDAYQAEIVALLNNGATKSGIARKYGTTRCNLIHWMKQHGMMERKSATFPFSCGTHS